MPICYDIDVAFIRQDEGHEGEEGHIPLNFPFPDPISAGNLLEQLRQQFDDWLRKLLASDPSRVPYFGQFQGIRIISVYEC